ncbi:hypothetical protein POTOM_047193 [Populus tomentosa]|uniref:Partial AB-hydrolase lipase domain-containing protein n=1 Tax=Populus tomentosa TaxID=118781 RepID=A0A8X8CDD6_POPTO|nr:hypothetical protein POTOM_047193 [Populus tomentosa]
MQIQLLSLTGQGSVSELASPPSADDSICKTLVETYGYACEEHTSLLSSVTIQSRRSDVYPKISRIDYGMNWQLNIPTAATALSKDQSLKMLRSAALFSPTAYLGQITSPVAKVSADIVTVNSESEHANDMVISKLPRKSIAWRAFEDPCKVSTEVGSRRTKLFSDKSQNVMAAALAPSVGDGVCASMIEPQDYICEEHTVTTEDGCILSLQRIPAWYSLVSMYSRGHVSLSPDDSVYWDWTWDELVTYDLPATFQYAHGQAGQNLHHDGTLIALAAFSKSQLVNSLRSAALPCPIQEMLPKIFSLRPYTGWVLNTLTMLEIKLFVFTQRVQPSMS